MVLEEEEADHTNKNRNKMWNYETPYKSYFHQYSGLDQVTNTHRVYKYQTISWLIHEDPSNMVHEIEHADASDAEEGRTLLLLNTIVERYVVALLFFCHRRSQ